MACFCVQTPFVFRKLTIRRIILLVFLVCMSNFVFLYSFVWKCTPIIPPADSVPEDFQKIGYGFDKSYVYSAYYDKQEEAEHGTVTIVGALKLNSLKTLHCLFYDVQGRLRNSFTTKVKLLALDPEYNDTYNKPHMGKLQYTAHYIKCNILCQPPKCPTFVTVTDEFRNCREPKQADQPQNILRIKYKKKDEGKRKYSFALCVRPIFDYDNPLQFAEWIEFYTLMGVEKFLFYNKSIGPKTSCLMKSYGDNLIEVLPWSDPFENSEIINHGQSIASHDCLQRFKGVAKYLIMVDLDEMIIPTSPTVGNNYVEMMRTLKMHYIQSEALAGYSFRNGWFFLQWKYIFTRKDPMKDPIEGNPLADRVLKRLVTANNIVRIQNMEPHNDRSKMILIPERVVQLSALHIPKTVDKWRTTALVKAKIAYTHHYRQCSGDMEHYCAERENVFENSAQRFARFLAVKVAARFDLIRETCNISLS